MRARRKQRAQPQPVPPPKPERAHFVPAWYADRPQYAHHTSRRISTWIEHALAGRLRLPKFQRQWVWTDEQIIRLLDSFVQGYHVGSLLLWEQYGLPPSRERFGEVDVESGANGSVHLVVDGQQRLGALVTAACSGRFWFHLLEGRVSIDGPGPWRADVGSLLHRAATVETIHWFDAHADEHGLPRDDVFDAWVAAYNALDRGEISATELPYQWPIDRVLETFRRINTQGTPIDPLDLEAALRRAREGGQ